MKWDFSFRLQPGENVLEKEEDKDSFGLKSFYSPILTDRRVIFRFNSLTSNMTQSFPYGEISDVQTTTRLLIKYLRITARGKTYLVNIDDPDKWAASITRNRDRFCAGEKEKEEKPKPSLAELLIMLETLRDYGLLTEQEFIEKRKRVVM